MENNVIFLGDVHAEFKTMIFHMKRLKISNSTIIQVGDFGMGFSNNDKLNLLVINVFLRSINSTMLVIRGNHDDPSCFTGDYSYSHIKLLPDYTTLNINDKKYLFIGGALSLDRVKRIELMKPNKWGKSGKICYWEEEVFKLDEEKIKNISGVDVLVTHTTPEFCFPYLSESHSQMVEDNAKIDKYLKLDLAKERHDVGRLFELLKEKNNIKYHAYGHFHSSHTDEFNECKHTLLNIYEFKELFR